MKLFLFLRFVDALILNRVQKFSDWMQAVIGGDNFVYAKSAYYATYVSMFYSCMLTPGSKFMQEPLGVEIVKIIGVWLIISPFCLLLYVVRFVEQRITSSYRSDRPLKNPFEASIIGRACRHSALVFVLAHSAFGVRRYIHEGFHVYMIFWFSHALCYALYLYFASCTPKPPNRERKEVPIAANAAPEAV